MKKLKLLFIGLTLVGFTGATMAYQTRGVQTVFTHDPQSPDPDDCTLQTTGTTLDDDLPPIQRDTYVSIASTDACPVATWYQGD